MSCWNEFLVESNRFRLVFEFCSSASQKNGGRLGKACKRLLFETKGKFFISCFLALRSQA